MGRLVGWTGAHGNRRAVRPGALHPPSSPNILVMSMSTSDVREDAQAPDPAEERDPEPEAEEPQRTEGNEKGNEQTDK